MKTWKAMFQPAARPAQIELLEMWWTQHFHNFLDWSNNAMATYPKVKAVTPLSGKQLLVTFTTGDTRVYDCAPLLNESSFYSLKDDAFFKNVHVDQTGYGVVWNDNVDLSESELWINGKAEISNRM